MGLPYVFISLRDRWELWDDFRHKISIRKVETKVQVGDLVVDQMLHKYSNGFMLLEQMLHTHSNGFIFLDRILGIHLSRSISYCCSES